MRAVCAWCGTTLTEGDPGDRGVSHGICPACSRTWSAGPARCVVLPSHRSFLLPSIQRAFREIHDLRVIVDRRVAERRRQTRQVPSERRGRSRDRRQLSTLIVGAIPCVGGFWFPVPMAQGGQTSATLPTRPQAGEDRLPSERRSEGSAPDHPFSSPEESR